MKKIIVILSFLLAVTIGTAQQIRGGAHLMGLSSSGTEEISAPDAPDALTATNITASSFSANWSASSGATSYRLDVSENTNFSSYVTGWEDVNVGNVTTYSVNSGLSAETDYYYRVRAVNSGGTSGNSDTITVTTYAESNETGDYYVDYINGSDAYNGLYPTPQTGSDGPWKTVSKVNSTSLSLGDSVMFKRGSSWDETLNVDEDAYYGAYGSGEPPKIYGSNEIDITWSVHSGNIYKGSYSTTINQLFLDGERMRVARYPNSGWTYITSVQNTTTTFTSTNLPTSLDYTDSECYLRQYDFRTIIKSVSSQSGNDSIQLVISAVSSDDESKLKIGCGITLIGGLDLLDQAGEWWYDSVNDFIYVYTPDGTSPTNYTVRGSVRDDGIYSNDADDWTVENIEILHQSDNGVTATSTSTGFTLKGVKIHDVEGIGVYNGESYSTGITLDSVTIYNANSSATKIRSDNSTVTKCTIYDIALHENIGLAGDGTNAFGLFLSGDNNEISHNTLNKIAGHGIFWSRDSVLVEYNHVDSAALTLSDVGAIYGSDNGANGTNGTIIRYNIVTNTIGNIDGSVRTDGTLRTKVMGEGIYIDVGCDDVTVTDNTVVNSGNSGVKINGIDNPVTGTVIRLNTLYKNGVGHEHSSNSTAVSNYFRKNIVYAGDLRTDAATNRWNSDYQDMIVQLNVTNAYDSDSNYFFNHYNTDEIYRLQPNYANINHTEWLSYTSHDDNTSFDSTAIGSESDTILYNLTSSSVNKSLTGDWKYINSSGVWTVASFPMSIPAFESRIFKSYTPGSTPAFVGAESTYNSSTTSVTVSVPSGTSNGDLMLGFVNANGSSPTIDTPTGWTKLAEYIPSGATMKTAVFYRTASSEPSSYDFTVSTSADRLRATIYVVENVDTSDPFDDYDNDVSWSGTSITGPTVTNSTVDNYLMYVAFVDATATYPSTDPTGMTERENPTSNGNNITVWDEILDATGATGTRTATLSASGAVHSWMIILNQE